MARRRCLASAGTPETPKRRPSPCMRFLLIARSSRSTTAVTRRAAAGRARGRCFPIHLRSSTTCSSRGQGSISLRSGSASALGSPPILPDIDLLWG